MTHTTSPTQATALNRRILISQWLSLFGLGILMGLLILATWVIPLPEGTSIALVLSIKLVPLLVLVPGLLMDRLRAHIWLCFVLLIYFTQSAIDTFLTQGFWLYGLTCALTVIIFLSSMMHVRWSKQAGVPLNPGYSG